MDHFVISKAIEDYYEIWYSMFKNVVSSAKVSVSSEILFKWFFNPCIVSKLTISLLYLTFYTRVPQISIAHICTRFSFICYFSLDNRKEKYCNIKFLLFAENVFKAPFWLLLLSSNLRKIQYWISAARDPYTLVRTNILCAINQLERNFLKMWRIDECHWVIKRISAKLLFFRISFRWQNSHTKEK